MEPAERTRKVAGVFDAAAKSYEAVGIPWFVPIGKALVDALGPEQNDAVLDIGCGKGAATFLIADRVGSGGRVVGIDISAGMIEQASKEAESTDREWVEWHVMDARAPSFDRASFDLIASSLVLFFLPEPLQALTAWRDLLRPGGRIGVSTFGERPDAIVALDGLFTPYLPEGMLDARTSGVSGPFTSDDGVTSLLAGAGFVDVVTSTAGVPLLFSSVSDWERWSQSHGQAAMWRFVPPEAREDITAGAAAIFDEFATAGGELLIDNPIRLTLGKI